MLCRGGPHFAAHCGSLIVAHSLCHLIVPSYNGSPAVRALPWMPSRSVEAAQTRVVPDYMYLRVVSTPACEDALTWRMALDSALATVGGAHGAAVPCDIMHIGGTGALGPDSTSGTVRCAVDDAEFVRGALGLASRDGTVFRVVAQSSYLPLLL